MYETVYLCGKILKKICSIITKMHTFVRVRTLLDTDTYIFFISTSAHEKNKLLNGQNHAYIALNKISE